MKEDAIYLTHILEAIQKIEDYTQAGHAAFASDVKTQDAVMRNLEIIGEAAKNLSVETKSKSNHIPWKQVAGMRDVLIHAYFGVNIDTVWETVDMQLPILKSEIMKLMRS